MNEIQKGATISDCGQFRYTLFREWGNHNKLCNFIMLNPSTADALLDDYTVRRCIRFASQWGCSGIIITNLYAYRTRYPQELSFQHNHVGPKNDRAILDALLDSDLVVAAWGAFPRASARIQEVLEMAESVESQVFCMGKSKTGFPRHPSRMPQKVELELL